MYKPEWGQKFICPNCSAKFYSMGKTNHLNCPSCKNPYDIEANRKLKNSQPLRNPNIDAKSILDDEVKIETENLEDNIFVEEDEPTKTESVQPLGE